MTWRQEFSVILCVREGKNEWKYYFEETLVQQPGGPRTITQPAFISVLTLFSTYLTVLLHITCGPGSEHQHSVFQASFLPELELCHVNVTPSFVQY